MVNFFTSDTHFNHTNIIIYCNRPFSDVGHMTEVLVNNWNMRVSPNDVVYHIGDFAMGNKNLIPDIRSRLNGKIILIKGNHDYRKPGKEFTQILNGGFAELYDDLFIEIDGIKIYLRHEPDMMFKPSDKAQYHICGHVHQSWTRRGNIINAGVDVHGYKPVTLEDLITSPETSGSSHRGY